MYRYIGSAKYRLPIWQNFQYRQFFKNCTPILYTSTNWLILLMHCLVVATFYCVCNHFASFLAILLLTMVYNKFYCSVCAIHGKKQLVMYIGLAIGIGFFLNNEYWISENQKILISVYLYYQTSNNATTIGNIGSIYFTLYQHGPSTIITLGHRAPSCTIWCAIGPYQKH